MIILLFYSCQIERRLYRNGYYVHSILEIRNKNSPSASYQLCNNENYIVSNAKEEIKTTFIGKEKVCLSNSDVKTEKNNTDNKCVIQSNFSVPSAEKMYSSSLSSEEPKEDVKKIFYSSIGVFIASLAYIAISITAVESLMNILFVLVPFGIVGIWIFASILHERYSYDYLSIKAGEIKIYSQKKAFLLAGTLGIFGAHRFYLGYTNIGLIEMFTLGGFFILYFIDMLMIKYGKLKPRIGDYGVIDSNYRKNRKKLPPDKNQQLIKLSVLISILAFAGMIVALFL